MKMFLFDILERNLFLKESIQLTSFFCDKSKFKNDFISLIDTIQMIIVFI